MTKVSLVRRIILERLDVSTRGVRMDKYDNVMQDEVGLTKVDPKKVCGVINSRPVFLTTGTFEIFKRVQKLTLKYIRLSYTLEIILRKSGLSYTFKLVFKRQRSILILVLLVICLQKKV